MVANTENGWRLDKRISITILLLLIGNIAVGAWWASEINTRVLVIESEIARGERFTKADGRDLQDRSVSALAAHINGGPHDNVEVALAKINSTAIQLQKEVQQQRQWIQRLRDQLESRIERLERRSALGPPR